MAVALVVLTAALLTATSAFAAVTRYEETHSSIAYTGTWTPSSLPGHSGGAVAYTTDAPGASATISFNGTGVAWIAAKWYNRGIGAVSLDGGPEQMFDLYAPGIPGDTSTVSYQQVIYSVSGLTNGPHTLRVRVTGNFNPPAQSPYLITLDAFDVTTPDPVVSSPASSLWSVVLVSMLGLGVIGWRRSRFA